MFAKWCLAESMATNTEEAVVQSDIMTWSLLVMWTTEWHLRLSAAYLEIRGRDLYPSKNRGTVPRRHSNKLEEFSIWVTDLFSLMLVYSGNNTNMFLSVKHTLSILAQPEDEPDKMFLLCNVAELPFSLWKTHVRTRWLTKISHFNYLCCTGCVHVCITWHHVAFSPHPVTLPEGEDAPFTMKHGPCNVLVYARNARSLDFDGMIKEITVSRLHNYNAFINLTTR